MANWYVRSSAAGLATGADWTNAKLTLAAALTASAAGDSIYVSEDHAETQASALTATSPGTITAPSNILCVNHLGSVPPVSADLRTTATVTTTGNNGLTIRGTFYCYGITFNCGNSTGTATLTLGSTAGNVLLFEACSFVLGGSGASSKISLGSGMATIISFFNCKMQFGSIGQSFSVFSRVLWRGTASAISGSTFPTTLMALFGGGSSGEQMVIEGVDLSALGSGKTLVNCSSSGGGEGNLLLKDCKLGSGVTIQSGIQNPGDVQVDYTRCDSGGTNYISGRFRYAGTQSTETVIIRTGGASDGTTAISWKIVTTANSKWLLPFEAMPIAIWNDVAPSNVTVTIEGLVDPRTLTALPNNDDIWFEVEFLGASGSPLGSIKSGTKSDALATGSALTASTQAWDTLVTARANSTAYSLGDARKVASNSGRVFICTTAGTSASSEPGGYATAVDGGSVTDGTATFKAAVRFKQAITLSSPQPGQKGALYVYPKIAKASGTFYIDPLIALS